MASTKGDPARDPKPFVNPYKNLDLPPEAFTFGKSVSLTVFVPGSFVAQYRVGTLFVSVSILPFSPCQLPDSHFRTIMLFNGQALFSLSFFVMRSSPR
ncbi:hypothetical protein DPV78_002406 [Talaromyces pinophilus]|jgi:hypothetical protein|nr:hypothetical protein DPV78_002406 [Talaromyces pinophilus]